MSHIQQILEEEYYTLSQIMEKYSLSKYIVNYLIRERDRNGLGKILTKINRKFFIKKEEFNEWYNTYYYDD